jgi:hypothetical protein
MRHSVKVAPTSIPPTAIGRTMYRQTWSAIPAQSIVPSTPVYPAASSGPRKKMSRGTKRPQARRPPAKFRAPSSGPMMKPTPR